MSVPAATSQRRDAWLEIDLDALRENLEVIRRLVAPAAVAPVVKAEAYGHGLIAVGRVLAPHAEALCVATLDEALALRAAADGRIILLYPAPAEGVADAIAADIELSVMDAYDLANILRALAPGRPGARVHLGVDTGMGRGGLPPEAVADVAAEVLARPGVELAGIWSHLHSPEEPTSAQEQLRRFDAAVGSLRATGLPLPPRHVAASGGIFAADEPALELVRPGLAVYGLLDEGLPIAASAREAAARLRPAMSLKARPVAFSRVSMGGSVGYGATWRAERPSRIAVLPVGYADGFLRGSQPGATALVRGRRVPVVGRVSMDAICVDVTDVEGVGHGDEFVLLGRQGEQAITATDLARQRNTISWEVLAGMAQRLTRVYYPLASTSGGHRGQRSRAQA